MKTTKLVFGILSVTLALLARLHGQSFLTNGLVAYYPFDGNANDASGNANNGTISGTDSQYLADRFGQPQGSLYLNTTSTPAWNLNGAYVTAARSAGLDFNGDFTFSLWVNLSSGSGTTNLPENLISNGSDATSVNLRLLSDQDQFGGKDGLQFLWGGPNSDFYVVLVPSRQTWWQITVVRSGTNCILYKDGSALTNSVAKPTANTSTILVGRHDDGGGNGSYFPLVGGINDVRFYNRALSAAEVQQLYVYESGPRIDLIKAVKPSFSNLSLTTNYQLQVSTDLTTWTNSGSVFTATNSSMVYPQYFDVDNWNQLFFRLQVTQ